MSIKFGLVVAVMGLTLSSLAQTAAFNGFCNVGGTGSITSGLKSSNYLQGVIPGCTVKVVLTGTQTLATIYKDSSNTPLANPFTATTIQTTQTGQWLFYAATGQGYDVVMSGGIAPNTFPAPVTLTDLIVPSTGGGGSGCNTAGDSGTYNASDGSGGCIATPASYNSTDSGFDSYLFPATVTSGSGALFQINMVTTGTTTTGGSVSLGASTEDPDDEASGNINLSAQGGGPANGYINMSSQHDLWTMNGVARALWQANGDGSQANTGTIQIEANGTAGGGNNAGQVQLGAEGGGTGSESGTVTITTQALDGTGNFAGSVLLNLTGNPADFSSATFDVDVTHGGGSSGDISFETTGFFEINNLTSGTCANGVALDTDSNLVLVACPGGSGFPVTLGSTSITASSTTTAVSGLTVNGVTLDATGSSSSFLSEAGTYVAIGSGVTSINSSAGAFTFSFSSGAGSCSGTTCTFTGSGSGGGSVTNFIASSGSWPTWLVPSVATSTTTPTLSVTANAIPNSALATQTANTVLGALTATTPSGLPMTDCHGATNAVTWQAGVGFGCNAISSGTTTNALTLNNGGSGASSGTTFNGAAAVTLSYNTLGAAGLAASNTFTGSTTNDFSGTSQFKLPVAAGFAPAANGEIGYDTTNKNWHVWANAVNNIVPVVLSSATITNSHCVDWLNTSSVITLADSGSACGTGNTTSTSLTTNIIPKANGANSVINSALTDNGTSLSYAGSSSFNVFQLGTNLFSALPTCNSGQEGSIAPVTDSTTNTWGATITGSGSDHVMGYCNGTLWTVMAF